MAKLGFAALCAAAALVQSAVADGDDLSAAGACKVEIQELCATVEPGDSRLARCIREKGSVAVNNSVTKACTEEMTKLFVKIKQGKEKGNSTGEHPVSNVSPVNPVSPEAKHLANPVVGFREACSKDMKKFCEDSPDMATTSCLKVHKPNLTEACKTKLFSVMEHEANDVRLDPALSEACRTDMAKNGTCTVVLPPGAQLACLRANRKNLQDTCRNGLFKRDQADAEDIRLNVDVLETCAPEIKSKCKDVQFGEARILHCLWEAMHKPSVDGFDEACREKVVKLTEQHLRDYRLDFKVRTHCEHDIKAVCAWEKLQVDSMTVEQLFSGVDQEGLHHEGDSGAVLHCLKKNMDNLKKPRCVNQLTRLVRIEAVQFGTSVKLLSACRHSVEQFCSSERRQGIHKCLRNHITELDTECRTHELLQGSLESRDIRMKPQILFVCTQAMGMFCPGVAPGAAQMLHCLQDHRTVPSFPTKCAEKLHADMEASNRDWRLKHGLITGCKNEIDSFCADVKEEGGGKVTSCLQHHFKNITNTVCRAEVGRFIGEGLEDIHLAPVLHKKCEGDIVQFCHNVPPGAGRIRKCLMGNRAQLSTACAQAMFEKAGLQSEDITVNHRIAGACQTSIDKYCKDVRSGGGRIWRCLEDHLKELPELCKTKVSANMELKHANFQLNPHLAKSCSHAAQKLCPAEMAEAKRQDFSSNGSLVTCMINHRDQINSTDCKQSLLRKEKQRVAQNVLDPMAKQACQQDVQTFCSLSKTKGNAQMQKCLQHHLAVLSRPCAEKIESYVVLATVDIRFNDVLFEACALASNKFCAHVEPGMGRKVSCLIDHMHEMEVDSSCKDLLVEQQMWRAQGLQFNPSLKRTCSQDLLALLKGVKCEKGFETQGWKINCLTANRKDLKDQNCKSSVFQMLQRQSADARMKPGLMQACKQDITMLCPDVSPGKGLLHQCLRQHKLGIVAASCKALVAEVETVDKMSASLNYNIAKDCRKERNKFCQDTEPGAGRILACLTLHNSSADFSSQCRKSLNKADLKAAVAKHHTVRNTEQDIKDFIMNNRSFFDKHWVAFLVGTCVFMTIFVIQFIRWLLKKQLVVPQEIDTIEES